MNEYEFPALSGIEYLVMEMLERNGEMFGLEMVDASGGELKKGTIYVTLGRMADKGLVDSRTESESHSASQKRLYSPTEYGKRVFKAQEIALKYLNMGAW
ncbi:MAG: PadR family transcriptional regulator [Acidobacteriota bacterium]|nr:MAG: PadR family transcriptional regulator [Acidobacteriota bacterium]